VWSIAALGGIVYGVIEAPTRGWTDRATLGSLAVGVAALAGFIVHELRSQAPSLDVRLFRNRGLAAGSLLVSLQFFASFGLFVLAPQYLQIVREYSPLQAATSRLVIPVGIGAGSALAPALLHRTGPRLPGAGGLATMAAGFAVLAVALAAPTDPHESASLWLLGVGLALFGFGFGLAVTPGNRSDHQRPTPAPAVGRQRRQRHHP
jgi:predicted MFS family arabinose efflux permease